MFVKRNSAGEIIALGKQEDGEFAEAIAVIRRSCSHFCRARNLLGSLRWNKLTKPWRECWKTSLICWWSRA